MKPFTLQLKRNHGWLTFDSYDTLSRARQEVAKMHQDNKRAKASQPDIPHPDIWVRVLDADRREIVKAHKLN